MSTRTSIEWVTATDGTPGVSWNFLRGCRMVSPGCTNCYAQALAARFSGPGQPFEGLAERTPAGPRWTGRLRYLPRVVQEPLRWKGLPRRVFINSMSDLAHEDVEANWIDTMLQVIAATPSNTYIGLTKRPERLWRLLYAPAPDAAVRFLAPDASLPNLILGTSVESEAYISRVEHLLAAWSGPTVVSAEPLLGPLDLTPVLWRPCRDCAGAGVVGDGGKACVCARYSPKPGYERANRLSWIIAGGESGPGARPCALNWLRQIQHDCQAAGVPCFLKQMGAKPVLLTGATGRARTHQGRRQIEVTAEPWPISDRKGAVLADFPADLRVRQWPLLKEVPHDPAP